MCRGVGGGVIEHPDPPRLRHWFYSVRTLINKRKTISILFKRSIIFRSNSKMKTYVYARTLPNLNTRLGGTRSIISNGKSTGCHILLLILLLMSVWM